MAVLLTPFFLQFEDDTGVPLAGGSVTTYAAGTNTLKATFTDFTEAVPAANPIILDAAGRCTIWASGSYKLVLKDALGNVIRTTDNVTTFNVPAVAANSYFQSFSGTGAQTVFTLSENLGSDENSILVFVDAGGTKGYDIINPSAFTLSGTSLTFAVAPAVGVNNIYIFAPSLLLGAAAASAAAAATSETNAAASAADALADRLLADADVVLTHADVVLTHADVVLTHADVVLTHADVVAANNAVVGVANKWLFSGSTSMSDPGTGNIQFDNASAASTTALAISALSGDTGNPNIRAFLATWANSSHNPRGIIRIQKDATNFVIFGINAVLTDNTTWLQMPVAYITGSGTLSASDPLYITFTASGTDGSGTGTVTTSGSPTTGSLTQFTSATAIGNANLSGDVTTSGSLVTAIKSSVALAGNPTTTTQTQKDSSTKIATTAYTDVAASTMPQNSQSAAYTLVAADAGKQIYHPSADTTPRIWTIPANASVAYSNGVMITLTNDVGAGAITIAITNDTLVLAGAGTTGSRTLAAGGTATIQKMTSTRWMISGTGLT